jgi:cyclopropane fatty-acyl-phospholipid synthase-like methyltransferase
MIVILVILIVILIIFSKKRENYKDSCIDFYNSDDIIDRMVTSRQFSPYIYRTEFTFTHNNNTINELDYLIELGEIKNNIVLDFGCGVASTAVKLAKKYGCRVYGLNVSERQIEIGNEYIKNHRLEDKVKLYLYDGYTFPKFPEKFDRIIYQESMCHVKNKSQIIEQLLGNLKKGGIIVGQDWYKTKDSENISNINEEWFTNLTTQHNDKQLYEKYGGKVVSLIDAKKLINNNVYFQFMVNRDSSIGKAFFNKEFIIGFIKCIKL